MDCFSILTICCWFLLISLLLNSFPGEDIWRFVGKLTDAQKSMLDDRFKWKVSLPRCLYLFLLLVCFHFSQCCIILGSRDGEKEGR